MSGIQVDDAVKAQSAAKRYLAAQFGTDMIKTVTFSKAWYTPGSLRDLWEVEGDAVLKKGWFGKVTIPFMFQVDPSTGRVIAFERGSTLSEGVPSLMTIGLGGGIIGSVIGAIGVWAVSSIGLSSLILGDFHALGNYVFLASAICGAVSAITTQYACTKMNQDKTRSLIIGIGAGLFVTVFSISTIASALGVPGSVIIPVALIGLGVSFLTSYGINIFFNS